MPGPWYSVVIHSVRGRVIAAVVVLYAVLMGLVVAEVVTRAQEFMQGQLSRQGESLARTLAVNAPSWLISSDVNGMNELVDSVRSSPNLRLAMILDRDGRVRASTDPGLFNLVLDDASSRTLLDGASPHQTRHDGLVDSAVDIAAPSTSSPAAKSSAMPASSSMRHRYRRNWTA